MKKLIIPVLILCSLLSCATGAGGGKRPDWTLNPPADTGTEMFFVGIGSDPDGTLKNAEDYAASSVVKQITEFLGVKITSETSMEARSTLESLQVNMVEQINQKSEARISEFRIVERWEERDDTGGINVYLLASYGRQALMEEKARLEQLFAEQVEAVSGPELEGDTLAAAGNYFPAVVQYLTAASNAAKSDLDNREIKFRRNLSKATEALDKLQIIAVDGPTQGLLGQPFTAPFRVSASYGVSTAGIGGIPVRVSYKILKQNGKKGLAYETVVTDEDGIAVFTAPLPPYTGEESITMSVDLRKSLEFVDDLSSDFADAVESLETVALTKKVRFDYKVDSKAKTILTALSLADFDENGDRIAGNAGTHGMAETLVKEGFLIEVYSSDDRNQGTDPGRLFTGFKQNEQESSWKRVALGEITISDVSESRGSVVITVDGSVSVFDRESGRLLYTADKRKSFVGDSVEAVRKSVFSGMGEFLADDLKNNLP